MASESSGAWRLLLEAYLRSRVLSADDPNLRRWLWQSAEYEAHHTDNTIKLLSHTFKSLAGVKILDFGSGAGLDAINLAKNGAIVTGIEIDSELRTIAQARSAEADVQVCYEGDFEKMFGIENGKYDALISVDVIEHVKEWETVVQSAISLVRIGGAVVIATPNRWAISNILADPHWKLLGVTLMPRWLARWYVCKVRRAVRHYDVWNFVTHRQLIKCLKRSGCRIVSSSRLECAQKLLSPQGIQRPQFQKLALLMSALWRNQAISEVTALVYTLFATRSWSVAAVRIK
jgi:SAM-dependent methyltransferase